MSTNPRALSLNLGAVIGVTIAASVVVFLTIVGIAVLFMRRKYKFVLAHIEQEPIANPNATSNCNIIFPPITHGEIGSMSRVADIGWTGLPSNENVNVVLQAEEGLTANSKTRISPNLLPWPLPEKTPDVSKPLKSFRDEQCLHSDIEAQTSGQNIHRSTDTALVKSTALLASSSKQDLSKSATNDSKSNDEQNSPSKIGIAITGSTDLKPLPLFSLRQSIIADARPSKADRSFSVPSLLVAPPADAIFGTTQSHGRTSRHPRSVSLGSHNFYNLPSEPCPPLPLSLFPGPYVHLRLQGGSLLRKSSSSTESFDAFGSVRNKGNHNSTTSKVRDPVTMDCHSIQPDTNSEHLIAGPRPMKPKHKITLDTDISPPHLSIPTRTSPITPQRRARTPNNTTSTTTVDLNRLSVGEIHTAESVRMSRISNSSNQTELISTIHVLSTPNRENPNMRSVSIQKAPSECKRPSILRDISGNKSGPSRDSSQNSILTHMSEDHNNPFSWESPVSHKRSNMKISPGSKRLRKKGSVRISSVPDFFDAASRTTSPSRMDGIAEEGSDKPLRSSIAIVDTDIPNRFDRLPHSQTFSPRSYRETIIFRASLTPSSPTLSIVPFHQDDDLPASLDLESNRQSTMNTHLTIAHEPMNPPEASRDSHTEDETGELTPTAKSFNPCRSSPSIPGLTLISQPHYSKQDLCYPTIELPVSPVKRQPWSNSQSAAIQSPHTKQDSSKAEKATAPMLSGFSPPSKAGATTQVTQLGDYPIPTIRPTPLSSTVDPSNTSPYRPESNDDTSESLSSKHPQGPRPPPGRGVLQSIQKLRRDDSQLILNKSESRGARRHYGLGRQPSPDLSEMTLSTGQTDVDEIEGICTTSNWDDGAGFWEFGQVAESGAKVGNEQKSLGGYAFNEKNPLGIILPGVRGSLYDASGFLLT